MSPAARTTSAARPSTSTDVLAAVEALAPELVARAPEVEAGRRLPADLLQQLIDAGCFRLLLPGTHGGLGADLPRHLQVLDALGRADGSTAWTVMIGGASWIDLAGLPRSTFDGLFAADPDVIVAGVFNPTGQLETVPGGYRVTGRWAFASGCEHAGWIWGNCVEGVVDGVPQLRVALFEPDQVAIEDTWDTVGMRGTGSHHVRADGVVVPADRTARPMVDPPCLDVPIVRVPPPSAFGLSIAAVALGIARGALDEITALAADRTPLLAHGPIAVDPNFQAQLARADTDLAAATALLADTATTVWATAVGGGEPSPEERARTRAAAVWVVERAAGVVEAAYLAGGSAALHASSPLQRRLRDLATLRQHFLVRADTMVHAGELLAGQELTIPVF